MNGRRRRRRLRLAKGCTRFTSEVRGEDLLPRPEPVSGEEVGCNGCNGWSNYCGYDVTVNGDGYEGGGSGHCESDDVAGNCKVIGGNADAAGSAGIVDNSTSSSVEVPAGVAIVTPTCTTSAV